MMKSLTSISTFVLTALLSQQLIADEISGRSRVNMQTGELIIPCVQVDDPEGDYDGRYFDVQFEQNGTSYDFNLVEEEEEKDCLNPNLEDAPPPGFEVVVKICGNSDTPQWGGPCYYRVGDNGPAGGIVFYVTAGGLHGLEVARGGQGQIPWCYEKKIGANKTAIGSGAENTAVMLKANCGGADRLATNYRLNGFAGWFLPSLDELMRLWSLRNVVGGFADAPYWSSSEIDDVGAWLVDFGESGHPNNAKKWGAKYNQYRVRAVRAF
ncbi:MAG: hypothetical protein ACQ9MH_15660 [Nitrospinales bacterium]